MRTTPLLLAAALMLWGWQTGLWWFAVPLAAALEFSRLFKVRWDIAQSDLDRLWNLSAAALGACALYLIASEDNGLGVGGWIVARAGVGRALLLTGVVQTVLMGLYVLLSLSPGNHTMLFIVVMTEAFTHAMATSAFLAYLSTLTAVEHTATQFALLTSLAPLLIPTAAVSTTLAASSATLSHRQQPRQQLGQMKQRQRQKSRQRQRQWQWQWRWQRRWATAWRSSL